MTFLIFALAAIAVPASPPEQRAHRSQQGSNVNIRSAQKSAAAHKSDRTIKPSIYVPPCKNPKDQDQCSLQAEWEAAEAAREAADWAKWQTIISAFGIVGLLFSLALTRAATRAAMKANEGADNALAISDRSARSLEDQVDISRKASERELRAYVGVSLIEVNPAGQNRYSARLHFKNYGRTPAHNCRIYIGAVLAAFPTMTPEQEGPAPSLQCADLTLYPSAEVAGYATCEFQYERSEIEDEKQAPYVYGSAHYLDGAGIERSSNFAYRGTGRSFVNKREMHACLAGNSAT